MNCKQYRSNAHDVCKPNMSNLVLITLVFELILGACSALEASKVVEIALIGSIGTLLISGPLSLGYAKVIVLNEKKEEVNCNTLFSGFKSFDKSLALYLLEWIYILLWSLLLIIPGIIKAIAYSMSYYILIDHPELTANECITKSKEMMKGHKWDLFCLILSYFGWLILCVLTLGVLSLWVTPKMETAAYLFYKDINKEVIINKESI